MKLSELPDGTQLYTALSCTTLAVLSRRIDGWCVYVAGVPGNNHNEEWQKVAAHGDKQNETVAKAIVTTMFFPNFEVDLPYAR